MSAIPNSFQTPNIIIDKLMFLLTDSEFRVLMWATRQILGWHDKIETRRADISLSNFEGCGLSRTAISKALKSLTGYQILEALGDPGPDGQAWELSFMTKGVVNYEGLQNRKNDRKNKRRKQTEKARAGQSNSPAGGQSNSPAGGQSNSPAGGQSNYPNKTQVQTQVKKDSAPAAAAKILESKINHTSKKQFETTRLPTSDKLTGEEYNEFIVVLQTDFNLHGGRHLDVYHQLRGSTKSKVSKRYHYGASFRGQPVTLAELKGFAVWYKRKYPGNDFPIKADAIGDWFGKYRARPENQPAPEYVAPDPLPALDVFAPSPFDLVYEEKSDASKDHDSNLADSA